jgi:hypothetical protein
MVGLDDLAGDDGGGVFNRVAQFADIARPGVRAEQPRRLGTEE